MEMGMITGVTEKQAEWLMKHYRHTMNRDICSRWGWSKYHLRYVATKMGLKKTKAFKRKTARDALKHKMTEEQREWMRLNFPIMKNDDVAAHLGMSLSVMHRYAREMGLKKTAAFIKQCQANTTEAARTANMISGWPPKGYVIPGREKNCFKKGESFADRFGEEKNAERLRKSAEGLRKRRESEKRRVAWGLPQLTKLKVVHEDMKKKYERWYLKKLGYMIDEEERVAYYDCMTKRARIREKRGNKFYEVASICELMEEYWEEFRNVRDRYLGIEVKYNDLNIDNMNDRKKRIYLSGPISGVENAKEIFSRAAAILRGRGFVVMTPFENGVDADAPYEEHMKADIDMLKGCDLICMLQGWEKSPGARRERAVAEERRMNIVTLKK